MNTYGAQMDRKWTGSGLEVTGSGAEVGQKWTGSVYLSVCMSVHPKHFPYLLDKPYARDLQAQGACALRFFKKRTTLSIVLKAIDIRNRPEIKSCPIWLKSLKSTELDTVFKKVALSRLSKKILS